MRLIKTLALLAAGMSAAEVVRSATSEAAELLGMSGQVGVLEPGARADLVAFERGPLGDVSELGRARFVMQGGRVVRNDLNAGRPTAGGRPPGR